MSARLHFDRESIDERLISAWPHCHQVFLLCTLKTRVYRQQDSSLVISAKLRLTTEGRPDGSFVHGADQMNDIDQVGPGFSWGELPLCGNYLAVSFKAFRIRLRGEAIARDREALWALGVLNDGQYEVMGAWATHTSDVELWRKVFEDLKVRGVEGVRFVVGCDSAAIKSIVNNTYPGATLISSASTTQISVLGHACASASVVERPVGFCAANSSTPEPDAVAIAGMRTSALSARHRQAVLASADEMIQLDRRATRAIERCGGFADMYTATAFLLDALMRAQRWFGSAKVRVDPAEVLSVELAAGRDNQIGSRAVGL